jgi:hypothetical protein
MFLANVFSGLRGNRAAERIDISAGNRDPGSEKQSVGGTAAVFAIGMGGFGGDIGVFRY